MICIFSDSMLISVYRYALHGQKGGMKMEIGALASSALYHMEQNSSKINGFDTPSDIGVAMLDKQLDASEASGASLIRAMELSVNPGIGGNVDFYA